METIKKIRLSLGIPQGKMIPNMSKTTYSKIERGETELKYNILLAICASFGMTIEELLLCSSANEHQLFMESMNNTRNDVFNIAKKNAFLDKYYRSISKSSIKLMNLVELNHYCAIKCLFVNIWAEIEPFTSDEIQFVTDFLTSKRMYVQLDYQILMNSILFMNELQTKLILETMYPIDTRYRRTDLVFNYALRAILNVISLHIYRLEYKEANEIIKFAEDNLDFTTNYSLALSFEYHKNIVNHFLLKDTLYIQKAREIIDIMKTIGKENIALTFEEELNNLSERADYYLDKTVSNYPRTPVE